MKIAYICKSKIPSLDANSVHVMKMCQAFTQNRHETTLIIPRTRFKTANKNTEFLKEHYGVEIRFKYKYFHSLPGLRGKDFCLRTVIDAKLNKYDLVYSRYLEAALSCASWKIPTVFEAHSPPCNVDTFNIFNRLFKTSGFKQLVVISSKLKEIFLKEFPDNLNEDKIQVAHDGVDIERFCEDLSILSARKITCLNEKSIIIGYSGHLYKGRGLELILDLAAVFADCTFIVMGGKNEMIAEHGKTAIQNGITNIKFLGFISNAKLQHYLWSSDILLMPYQKQVFIEGGRDTSLWMSPLKMFEYMASKRIIISSDLPVLREVLNEKNSILCNPENIQEWIDAIKFCINNKNAAETLAINAGNDVSQYSWDNRVKTILEKIS